MSFYGTFEPSAFSSGIIQWSVFLKHPDPCRAAQTIETFRLYSTDRDFEIVKTILKITDRKFAPFAVLKVEQARMLICFKHLGNTFQDTDEHRQALALHILFPEKGHEMKTYTSRDLSSENSLLLIPPYELPELLDLPAIHDEKRKDQKNRLTEDDHTEDDTTEDGVAVTSYGVGRVSGVMYTVPAHGEIDVDFRIRLLCVTPEDIRNLSNLIESMIDASKHGYWNDYSKTHVSGGASFFGFFSGGVRASYTRVKQRMEWWGLSEENQRVIIDRMTQIAMQTSEFNYRGRIYNRDYSYSVSGNMFCIIMDATIKQGQYQTQLRHIAPKPHLRGTNGETLPTIGDLYEV